MTKYFVFIAVLVLSPLANATGYSNAPRSCESLFQLDPNIIWNRAVTVLTSTHQGLAAAIRSQSFLVPRVIALIGEYPKDQGWHPAKEVAVTDGIFPMLHVRRNSTALVTSDELFSQIRRSDKQGKTLASFPRFQVLAISNLNLSEMGFSRLKDLGDVIRNRFDRQQSTILLTDGNDTVELSTLINRIAVAEVYQAFQFDEQPTFGRQPDDDDGEE